MINQRELELTAYHEAGHAVVASLLRFPVDRVSIDRVGEFSGAMLYRKSGIAFGSPSVSRREIIVVVAGPLAEAIRCYGEENVSLEPNWNQDAYDFQSARHYADIIARSDCCDRLAVLSEAVGKAYRLLIRPFVWSAIEAVANELLMRRTISGERVAELSELGNGFGPLMSLLGDIPDAA